MITRKKIFLGAAIVWLLTLLAPLLVYLPEASASSPPTVQVGNDFKFTSAADITGSINGSLATFHDGDITDTTFNYHPIDLGSQFCDPGGGWGINLANGYDPKAKTITGTLNLGYESLNGNSKKCVAIPPGSYQPSNQVQIDNSNGYAAATYIWKDAKTIESGDGKDTWVNKDNGATKSFFKSAGNGAGCDIDSIIITDGPNNGKIYYLIGGGGDPLPNEVKQLLNSSEQSFCRLMSKAQLNGADNPQNITITGSPSNPPGGGGGAVTGNGSDTCEASSNIGLEWLVCPLIKMIDGMVVTFYNFIDDQLCFQAGASSTQGGVSCGGNLLTDQVKQAWNVFRVIASSLLVIVMLVMVISQAMGGGIFDAYTVRKLLPKLVAAAILIQISWFIAKFLIDISNDLGRGIADLIYGPFGGRQTVGSIDHALRNLGGGGVLAGVGVFGGMIAVIAVSGITLGGILLMAVTGLAALFVGFLVLFLRKILILFCVIFIPIALLTWILPGTERFWRLWRENFTKLLLMFPMIAALIAAGRIFAQVAGGASSNITALVAVVLGFFGPLFILPKTFQWGGQAMSQIGQGLVQGTKGIRGKPKDYAMEKAAENRQYRAQERARRIATDPNAASRWDRLLAGRYNFARNRGARMRQYAKTVGEGQQAAREAVGQELMVAGYQNWEHERKLNALEAWLRGESAEGISAEGNEELRLFAFKTLADLGDQDRIRRARQQGRLRGSTWLKGRAENISSLNSQASDMGIQPDLSTVAPDAMASWKSHTFREWIRQVQNGVIMDNSDDGGGDIALDADQRAVQQTNAQEQARRIMGNRLVFDRLSADQQDFVRRIATREGTRVNVSDVQGVQLPTGSTLGTRQSSREDLISHLSTGTRESQQVAATLAQQLVRAHLNPGSVSPADQAGYEQVFAQIQQRARAPDSTPQMQAAYANLEGQVNNALSSQEADIEQRYTAAGSPDTAARVAAARGRSTAVRTILGI